MGHWQTINRHYNFQSYRRLCIDIYCRPPPLEKVGFISCYCTVLNLYAFMGLLRKNTQGITVRSTSSTKICSDET